MSDFKRTDRIAEMIQRKLAELIQKEIKDPRLPGFITVAAVKVTKDLGHAKVYFTVFNGDPAETGAILNSAGSFLRTALAKTTKFRTVPQLHFVHDKSLEYGNRLSRLIDEVNDSKDSDESDEEQ
ncbi:MAG: 30S ribosome-binding factor RbfA [Legionellaceae bacterium]|nr:30S ribosome-binding factor RbfA [Legionellaceae bacterium]